MEGKSCLRLNGRCPECGKQLKIIKPGRKIWKVSVMIEDERKNVRYVKCPQCTNTVACP